MRVSNLLPGQLPAPAELEGQANVSATAQPQAQAETNTPGLQIQLLIHEALETLLSNLGGTVENSQLLLASLPDSLQQEVRQILQQATPDTGAISRGMSTLVQLPKNLAEQLQNIVQTLQGTLYLEEQLTPDIWNTLSEKAETVLAMIRQNPSRLPTQTAPVAEPPAAAKDSFPAQSAMQNQPVEPNNTLETGIFRQPVQQSLPESAAKPVLLVLESGQEPQQAAKLATTAEPNKQSTTAVPLDEANRPLVPPTSKPVTDWPAKAWQVLANNGQDRESVSAAVRQLAAEFQDLPVKEQVAGKQILLTLLNQPAGDAGEDIQSLLLAVKRLQAEISRTSGGGRTVLPEPMAGEKAGRAPLATIAVPVGLPATQEAEAWTTATVVKMAKGVLDGGEIPKELPSVRLETLDVTATERQELQKAVNYLQDFLPQTVRQAAVAHNLPELPDLWLMFKFSEASKWKELPTETLQKAIRTIQELSATVQDSQAALPEKTNTANTMSFTMPIYFGDGSTVYPAYVRIYHERQGTGAYKREAQPETWLRIFFDTNRLGRVDAMFHLYQGNLLSVRTEFANDEAATAFRDIVVQVRSALGELPLTLTDFSVRIIPGETA
ncbi:hypothetical protein [Propionispora hippei]|uniref:Hook-length control protein FliK n=1 Tax=Propionispora hippei DSM 15287 TaxID=1123003 RepID=A0A1M6CXR0_9FIRM|nr:hypothetical protein [Propionispora hippei]SHI65769.1 hypothetical protein SAMN02745170_00777 [Propionispora hippei DSM 15287]